MESPGEGGAEGNKKVEGLEWRGERYWGGLRIMVVKLLFPPGEKKGVNDTLELPTPTRRSSLSFMEGERHTQPRGGEEARETAMPSHHPTRGRLKQKGRRRRRRRDNCDYYY